MHLFLQSKLSSEDIDVYLETNQDEDATETILAEFEVQARLNGLITRDRNDSKHDSGFSGDYDDSEFMLDQNQLDTNNGDGILNNNSILRVGTNEEEAFLSDGHNADVESEDEAEECSVDKSSNNEQEEKEEEELEKELTRLRISSLPAPLPEPESGDDRFESSVEISLNYDSSDSDTSEKRSTTSRNSCKGGTTSELNSRKSSQENIRTPKRSKHRYTRQHSSFRKMFYSNASLPEFCGANTETNGDTSDGKPLRRSKSFYQYRSNKRLHSQHRRKSEILQKEPSLSDCKTPKRHSSFNTPRKLRRVPSFLSSTERSPVKRKISLNEYIVVGRNSFVFGIDPNEEFNKSSL